MDERTLGVVLYPGFELLDVFGPLEAFGNLPGVIGVKMIAAQAGPVVSAQGPRAVKVEWVRQARWVDAGKFVTSSGVSAGIDMALAVIMRLAGRDLAENLARMMEYQWHTDADVDPFAKVWGLA